MNGFRPLRAFALAAALVLTTLSGATAQEAAGDPLPDAATDTGADAAPDAGSAQGAASPAPATTPQPGLALPTGVPVPEPLPVLTLDRERLFSGTRYGKHVIATFDAEAQLLQAENRRIDAALEAEERGLTDRRATTAPEQFRLLTEDFDSRVEALRTAQDAKGRDLTRRRDEARQTFYETALPVLGELMSRHGAVAIIDRQALILSFERIDITDEAIARLDAVLGDGPDLTAPEVLPGQATGDMPQGPAPAPAQP